MFTHLTYLFTLDALKTNKLKLKRVACKVRYNNTLVCKQMETVCPLLLVSVQLVHIRLSRQDEFAAKHIAIKLLDFQFVHRNHDLHVMKSVSRLVLTIELHFRNLIYHGKPTGDMSNYFSPNSNYINISNSIAIYSTNLLEVP